jgi:peroxiredoxin
MTTIQGSVQREDGEQIPLLELLRGPTLLLFTRHWGCMECSLLLAHIMPILPTLADLDISVVVVGNGSAAGIAHFRNRYGLECEVVTDPTLKVHGSAGLRRSYMGGAGPRALWTLATGWAQGHPNKMGDGDMWQQGAAILADAQGQQLWRHDNTFLGDHARRTDVLQAILVAAAKERPWHT